LKRKKSWQSQKSHEIAIGNQILSQKGFPDKKSVSQAAKLAL
jgi:hypothetical protein